MKKLIVTCALITSASVVSFAQNAQTTPAATTQQPAAVSHTAPNQLKPEMIADRRSKMEQKQLGLSDDQTKKVYDVELNWVKQNQAMRANGGQPGQGQATQMNMAKDQQMKGILTPEQFTKYQASRPKPNMAPGAAQPTTAPQKN